MAAAQIFSFVTPSADSLLRQNSNIDWDGQPELLFGRWLFGAVAFLIVRALLWPLFRAIATGLIPFTSQETDQQREEAVQKAAKYCWHGLVYMGLTGWSAILILKHRPLIGSFPFSGLAANFPLPQETVNSDPISLAGGMGSFELYMIAQVSWYLHSVVEIFLVDGMRGDFLVMMSHHLLAVGMLTTATCVNGHLFASFVCLEQDFSDCFMYAGKLYQKASSHLGGENHGRAISGQVQFFQTLWLCMGVFPMWWLCRVFMLSGVVYGLWAVMPAAYYGAAPMVYIRMQITAFLIMQAYWGVGIGHMAYKQATTGQFHDHFHDSDQKRDKKNA